MTWNNNENFWTTHCRTQLQGVDRKPIPDNFSESGSLWLWLWLSDSDNEITLEKMSNAQGILKPWKATGIDIISKEELREAFDVYSKAIHNCLHTLLKAGQGVSSWLISLLLTIHKKGATDNPDNHTEV